MRCAVIVILACFTSALFAENLFKWDTGFETGNHDIQYYQQFGEMIRTVPGNGGRCLEIDQNISWVRNYWTYAMKKGKTYTLSFDARHISGNDKIDVVFVSTNWRYWASRHTFTLSREWKRYNCKIKITRDGFAMHMAFMQNGNGGSSVFHLDNIQLEEGACATAYTPGEAVSMYPSVGLGEVAYLPEPPKMNINIFNAALPAGDFLLKLSAAGKIYTQKITLPAGKTVNTAITVSGAAAPGYYTAELELLDSKGRKVNAMNVPFVVTNSFTEKKPGFFGIQDRMLAPALGERIGVSRYRRSCNIWKNESPEPGKLLLPQNIKKFPGKTVLTLSNFLPPYTPDWALDKKNNKPDPKALADYFDAVIGEYKSLTDEFELMNEPDLVLRNRKDYMEFYTELLHILAPVAKKHGIKVSVNVGTGAFWNYIWKHAADTFDIASPHPYCSPRNICNDGRYVSPPENGAYWNHLKEVAAAAKKHGKLLNVGELGYAIAEDAPYNSDAAHRLAAYMSRMMLLARTIPECRFFMYFSGIDYQEAGAYVYGIWRTDRGLRPFPAVAAYAQLVHELDHVEYAKLILDSEIKIVEYKKNGTVSYAVWNAAESVTPLPVKLPQDSNARSLYGTPLKKAVISGIPFFVSENSTQTVLSALKKALSNRSPLGFSTSMRNIRDIKLNIKNTGFEDWQGNISVNGVSVGKVTVPRSSTTTVSVKLPGKNIPRKLKITAGTPGGKVFRETLTMPDFLQIRYLPVKDFKTFDYRKYGWTVQQNERVDVYPPDPQIPWKGAEDLSHKTLLGWDENNFYIFSEVTDDHFVNEAEKDCDTWQGDSIQLAVDSFNNAARAGYDSDDNEITIAMNKKAWTHQAPPNRKFPPAPPCVNCGGGRGAAPGVQTFITRNEKSRTTIYRIAIPKQALAPLRLRTGTVFGMDMCLNDRDPGEARYYMCMSSGLAQAKLPALFKKAVLVK